jgi:hypothetical protein
MPSFRWLTLPFAVATLLAARPAAAQQLPAGAGAWSPGPAATGDQKSLTGVIDRPGSGTTSTAGTLQVAGWSVDLTAQGWSGIDDVEIFSGAMENGGRPLAHAQIAQARPDVATALNNPYWTASGWSASVPTANLTSGPLNVFVYVHTPNRGWWSRQVSITVRPPSPARPATALQTLGNDISYPQCPTGAEPPPPAFAIVGVTGGRPYSSNPCLARQFAWALSATAPNQTPVGLYMNTANPGPGVSPNWPVAGTSTPRTCDGSASLDCAYDYGWLSAQDAYTRAALVVGSPAASQYAWWLDVEAANSWSSDQANNASTLQGVIEYLRSVNISAIGVYATSTDWEALVGAPSTSGPFGGLLNWRPGPSGPQDAPAWCSRTVTGGRVKFVQFPNGGFDTDFACF